MKEAIVVVVLLAVIGAVGIVGLLQSRPTPPPPCDCAERLADLDRRCTDAMARQVALLRSCELHCPEPEATP